MFKTLLTLLFLLIPLSALANTKAEIVMDMRDGSILHAQNADDRLHPASLTKMMTLYVVFDAISRGEVGLGDVVTVSAHAAARPPSRMNLKDGQQITIADLIRGTAIQSANDGATALAEAVSGSESAFVARMNATAQAMGLTNTTFRNPHGLTHEEQLTTARDMATLSWRLYHDHRAHYGLFSQRSFQLEGETFLSTNRRFLSGYQGATGLKTGYTRPAGYNLAATADRNGVVLLSIILGATSNPERFERAVALMNWGFSQANTNVAMRVPVPLGGEPLQQTTPGIAEHHPLRAALRSPGGTALVADIVSGHQGAIPQNGNTLLALPNAGGFRPILVAQGSGDPQWGVQIGLYPSKYMAEQALLKTALENIARLGSAPPSVVKAGETWSAAYTHMSRRQAESTCRVLLETGTSCAIFRYEQPQDTRIAAQP